MASSTTTGICSVSLDSAMILALHDDLTGVGPAAEKTHVRLDTKTDGLALEWRSLRPIPDKEQGRPFTNEARRPARRRIGFFSGRRAPAQTIRGDPRGGSRPSSSMGSEGPSSCATALAMRWTLRS